MDDIDLTHKSGVYNQALTSLGVLFLSTILHTYFKPYKVAAFDKIEALSLVATTFTLVPYIYIYIYIYVYI